MKYPKAGELKDRITVERKSVTQSVNGDLVNTWTTILTTWAKVHEKSGGYSFEAGKVNSQSRIETWIRFRPDSFMQVGDRVNWRGFSWLIENSPVSDPFRIWLSFMATLDIDTTQRSSNPEIEDTENLYVVNDYVSNYFE